MKSLHELWIELETWLEHFRKHAAPVQEVKAQDPAPQSPVVEASAPVAQEATPIVNHTDATAPGFVPLAPVEPAPVAPPPADTPDFVNGTSFDFKWQGANIIFEGKKTKTITGASGKVMVETNVRPNTKPYTLTVNGKSVYQEMVNAVNRIDVEASGDITVSVDQPEDSSVVMNFHGLG